jgi:hypothetical protein
VGASRPSDFDEHLKAVELLAKADEILPPILAVWRKKRSPFWEKIGLKLGILAYRSRKKRQEA